MKLYRITDFDIYGPGNMDLSGYHIANFFDADLFMLGDQSRRRWATLESAQAWVNSYHRGEDDYGVGLMFRIEEVDEDYVVIDDDECVLRDAKPYDVEISTNTSWHGNYDIGNCVMGYVEAA